MKNLYYFFLFCVFCSWSCGDKSDKPNEQQKNDEATEIIPCDIPENERKIVGLKVLDEMSLIEEEKLKILLQKYYEANSLEKLNIQEVKDHYFLIGKGKLNNGGYISFGIQIKGVCEDKFFFTRDAAFEQTVITKADASCSKCDLILHDENEGAHTGDGDTECCHHTVSEFEKGHEGGFSHLLFTEKI